MPVPDRPSATLEGHTALNSAGINLLYSDTPINKIPGRFDQQSDSLRLTTLTIVKGQRSLRSFSTEQ